MALKLDRTSAYSSSIQGAHSEPVQHDGSSISQPRNGFNGSRQEKGGGNNHRGFSNTRPHNPSIICVGVLVGLTGFSAFRSTLYFL